jgi:hypothetical protein
MALEADGKILVAGTSFNGVTPDFELLRLLPHGEHDPTFGRLGVVTTDLGPSGAAAGGLTIQADGKIVVVGATSPGTTFDDFAVVRYLGGGVGQGHALTADAGAAGTTSAGALLASQLTVYVDDNSGAFTADELARIDDALAAVRGAVAPYGIPVTEVDASQRDAANVVIDTGTTSAAGGRADGVLGCETDAGEITLIQGWSWLTSADATQIGKGQYDFQTIVTHELGHALGLGHRADPASVMYATLDAGTVRRALLAPDLTTPDSDNGPCALHAALPRLAPVVTPIMPAAAAGAPAVLPESDLVAWIAAANEPPPGPAAGMRPRAEGTRTPVLDNPVAPLGSATPSRLGGAHAVRDRLFAAFGDGLAKALPLLDTGLFAG